MSKTRIKDPKSMLLTAFKVLAVLVIYVGVIILAGMLPATGVPVTDDATSDVSYTDGTTQHVDSNVFGSVDKGDRVTVHLQLPDEPIADDSVLTFYIYHSVTEIKYGNTVLDSYGADIDARGDMVGEIVFQTKIPSEAWGHEITINLRATENAAFTQIRALKIYPASQAYRYYFEANPIGFIVSFPLLFIGMVALLTLIALGNFGADSRKGMYIALFSMIAALWTLTSVGSEYLLGLDAYGWTILDFVSIFILVIPILLYAYESEPKGRFRTVIGAFVLVLCGYFLVSAVLNYTNIRHFSSTLAISHLLTFSSVILLLVYAARRWFSGSEADGAFLVGLLIICFSGLYDLLSFNLRRYLGFVGVVSVQSVIPLGMMFFIVCLLRSYILDMAQNHKRADQAESLSKVIAQTPAGICVMKNDQDMTFMQSNEVFFNIFGLTQESAAEYGFTSLMAALDETAREDVKRLRKKMSGSTDDDFETEIPIRTKKGAQRTVLARLHRDVEDNTITVGVVDITQRKQAEEQLRMSEERYKLALTQSGKIFFFFDVPSRAIRLSEEVATRIGIPQTVSDMPEGFINLGMVEKESEEDLCNFYNRILGGDKAGTATVASHTAYEPEKTVWYELGFTSVFDANHQPISAIITYEDISGKRRADITSRWWKTSIASLPSTAYIVLEFDLTGSKFLNCRGELFEAPDADEDYSQIIEDFIKQNVLEDDAESCRHFLNRRRLLRTLQKGDAGDYLEFRFIKDSPAYHWARISIQLIKDDYSSHTLMQMVLEDITRLKSEKEGLERAAYHDGLTGLFNRVAAQEQISSYLTDPSAQHMDALLLMDIDRFKQVNDTYGHPFADTVLIEVANKLKSSFRSNDIVARWGGDEMLVFLKSVGTEERAKEIVAAAAAVVGQAMAAKTERGEITCSFGCALYPRDGQTLDALYKQADVALYEAKQKRNSIVWHQPE